MPAKKPLSPPASTQPPQQWRRLRTYAFDPGLSLQFETAGINELTLRLPWEPLQPGPAGEYFEVVDHDPASGCYYRPVDIDAVAASDGLAPDESAPQFHQQFVYAVAMTTLGHFEKALGRKVLWTLRDETKPRGQWETFVPKLRIFPHAFRGANAYYSREKMALLFGYFPAGATARGAQLPGGMVFTCLSHDIVAHETAHALLDSTLPEFLTASHPDMLAFHEAFADLVALFQHFSHPEVLRHQISQTRGDLSSQSLLGQLAQQFGQALGRSGGLREAIGEVDKTGQWNPHTPDPAAYEATTEPHERGALLVAAVFDAFLAIYRSRVADLIRLATGGSGILPPGALPPDLINRLAKEAAKTAEHVLGICIRALDYCPPVDLTFGDFLRALLTADRDLVPEDEHHYRVAFIEAFRRRGIYPRDVRSLSETALRWPDGKGLDANARAAIAFLARTLRDLPDQVRYMKEREALFDELRATAIAVHSLIASKAAWSILGNLEELTGLALHPRSSVGGITRNRQNFPSFEIQSVRPVRRHGPGGETINHVVIRITQRRFLAVAGEKLEFPGGCTLILDLDSLELRYAIAKRIADPQREAAFRGWMTGNPTAAALSSLADPVAHLHV